MNDDEQSDWSALFTGDAEHEQIAGLIEANLVQEVDILKVGHHGSKNALTPEVAQVLAPQLALVSAGAQNRYGHPAENTLQILESVGAVIKRTDEEGDVSCILRTEELVVHTLR